MKTLQRKEQPAKAAMSPEPKKTAASPPPGPGSKPDSFTARELDAAQQLIHLSESSTSAASGSSSPRSVNALPVPAPAPALPRGVGARGDGDEEDDEQEIPGSPRKTKRCRPIAEIYRATGRIGRCSLKNTKE